MAMMTSKPAKSLEIRVLYCKDLRSFNFFQKLSVYASLSLSSQDPSLNIHDQDRRRTPTDTEGDGNPEWNHTLSLDLNDILSSLPHDAYDKVFVRFDLFHEGGMFGDKRIGEVHVALSEVIHPEGRGSVRFVSYQVKNPDGKPNGVLTFSYKFEGELDCDSIGNGFAAIAGYPIVNPVEETSSASSSAIHYPKIDLEEHVVQETSYYPPPGTFYHPPQAPPPLGYPMPPPPPPPPPGYPMPPPPPPLMQTAAGGGCYYPAAQPMPAFGPWQHGHHHGHHHGHRHHCSTRGGGGGWRM